jgi:hypothetical protein
MFRHVLRTLKLTLVVVGLGSVLATGCVSPTGAPSTPGGIPGATVELHSTPQASETTVVVVRRSDAATAPVTPTVIPTHHVTEAASHRTATPSPQPTLDAPARIALLREMLRTNGGCELPCWWGVIPGKTTWETALIQFRSYGDVFRVPHPTLEYDYSVAENFDVKDGVVQGISIGGGTVNDIYSPVFAADWQRYALSQILIRHGEPSAVSLEVDYLCMERDCGKPGYRLFLVFEQDGIAVSYFGTAERTDPVKICPNPDNVTTISLALQAPDDPQPVLGLEHLDPAELPLIHPLTEVSTLTLGSFYETFKASDTACFTVPAKYWEELPAGP